MSQIQTLVKETRLAQSARLAGSARLTGNEEWVKAGTQGATIWARKYGNKDWWWPIVHVELDCGLITIDVCGKGEVWHLDDCAELRINEDTIIDSDDFYLQNAKSELTA